MHQVHSPQLSSTPRPRAPAALPAGPCRAPLLARLSAPRVRPRTRLPCGSALLRARLAMSQRPAPCRRPRARAPSALVPQRLPARPTCPAILPSTVSWLGWPWRSHVSRHSPAAHCPCYHNTVNCIAIQSQPSSPQYKPVYCNTLPAHPSYCIAIQLNRISLCCNTLSCNTMPSLVYLLLQYNKLYCNTVSPAARLLKSQYNCCIAIQIHSHLSP